MAEPSSWQLYVPRNLQLADFWQTLCNVLAHFRFWSISVKIQLAVSFLYLQVVIVVAWTEHVRRPESWLSSVAGANTGHRGQMGYALCSLLNGRTSTWWISHHFHLDLFASFKVENYFWRWHRNGLQWQDPDSRGGSSWTWIMFFQGVSILSKNSDEAKNSPTLCIGPSKQSQLPLKAMCTQANTCFLLLLHYVFLCPGCDALAIWLQQCWC